MGTTTAKLLGALWTILLLAAPSGATPSTAPRDVSALLARTLEGGKVPGMVGAVVVGPRVVALGAAGVRQRGRPEKVEIGDRFHIGSCTKAMTATVCAMLVEEGKLAWDRRVVDGLGDLAKDADPGWNGATLELLLRNRGGAATAMPPLLWSGVWMHGGPLAETRRFFVRGILAKPPAHPPGTVFEYSNAGFVLAGAMAETATGASWETLVRERLFEPLGMTSAGFGAPGTAKAIDQPRGHVSAGLPVPPGPRADNPPAIGPAGTVHCSVGDWAKFVALHLEGARGHPRFLKPETFARLHAPVPDATKRYAMGWAVAERPWAQGRVLTHSGSNTMWYAVTWVAPRKGFAVLVACNQGGTPAAQICDKACGALIRDRLARERGGPR
jgi:CubicO group peptidase (beta-lactamase class C family)